MNTPVGVSRKKITYEVKRLYDRECAVSEREYSHLLGIIIPVGVYLKIFVVAAELVSS